MPPWNTPKTTPKMPPTLHETLYPKRTPIFLKPCNQ